MAFAFAAVAAPNLASGQFASTKFTPNSQTANVGTNFSVDVVLTDPAGSYALSGVDVWINFDAAKLQAVAVNTGGSSPFTNVGVNQIDNTNGKLRYKATGGTINGASFTVAQIVFTPIAGGTSVLDFANVNTDIVGYGPFGVNGLAVDGSVTIVAPAPTQTLTILGGSGNVGDVASNVEYYNPVTATWQPAYLANYAAYGHPVTHPWGTVAGTNRWINYRTDGGSDPRSPFDTSTYWYLYRVRITVPADAQNATMTFSLKADNRAQVAINGVSTGPEIVGQATGVNADAVFSQNLHPGENTITLNVGDEGGLNGFNFRIDLTVDSNQPLEIVEPVTDTAPPVITAPAAITKEATSAAGAVVTFTATAVDAVDGPVAVIASPASGSTFALGTTPVGLAASDAAGNDATASFLVKVQDTIAPALAVPGNVTAEAVSASGSIVTYAAATATDAVTSSPTIIYSQNSGTAFPLGTTTVNVTAKDAANNTSSGSFSVIVQDTTAPVVTVPANITAEATSASGAPVSYPAATATDAVGVTSLTATAASGSTFPIGPTTVTVTAKDAANNTSSGSFTITVRDTTAPAIASVTPSRATLWPPNHQMVPITVAVVASDNTGYTAKIINVTSNEPDNGLGDGDTANDIQITGDLTVNLRAERGGKGNGRVYTITVEARDGYGNASVRTCTVAVPKSQGGK